MEHISELTQLVLDSLAYWGLKMDARSPWFAMVASILLFVVSWVGYRVARHLLASKLTRLILATSTTWDDELQGHGFFRRSAHLVPAILLYMASPLILSHAPVLLETVQKGAFIYLLITGLTMLSALLNTAEDIYNASPMAKRVPITGFIQVGKLLMAVMAVILIISSLLEKSPLILISGLGAVTAILLLVFKDTILGFVAGVQIVANRMVNNGDWIELPKYGADGEVLEIGLVTVKVQNWDKTISTVPTYSLIGDSVKNWRGMQESGGRRIKRAINIDIQSVRFADQKMLDSWEKIRFIKDYIADKKQELAKYNQDHQITDEDLLNARRLTNIGTFRTYMLRYLQNHPKLNKEMTLMVRQLAPTELGLPLEIYCFSADKNWVNYEGIQSDIFDHFLSMLPAFGLRAYQRVSDRSPS
ncbi:mechanosensitive ion channel family protein [Aliiglaciecola sp. CAU 1673]|uniref:mechanosensitive ion channel family protein n=1 Tax=Aliiglaciecola sp. CAU 1673 TaxID=3032595 RepID=UPI0023DBF5FE|nr:mechanosensitive ion channel family protein [Aliiglaciecola sp. CAU 1673]MDF2180292.1 mechanosensitive ion channel family protein [Aliiglaciecola sp. CAU 1673]